MKDIVITKKRIVLEAVFFFICFLIAEGLNLYGIRKYQTSYDELWSQWLTACILTVLFYGLFTAIRIAIKIVMIPLKAMLKKSTSQTD